MWLVNDTRIRSLMSTDPRDLNQYNYTVIQWTAANICIYIPSTTLLMSVNLDCIICKQAAALALGIPLDGPVPVVMYMSLQRPLQIQWNLPSTITLMYSLIDANVPVSSGNVWQILWFTSLSWAPQTDSALSSWRLTTIVMTYMTVPVQFNNLRYLSCRYGVRVSRKMTNFWWELENSWRSPAVACVNRRQLMQWSSVATSGYNSSLVRQTHDVRLIELSAW